MRGILVGINAAAIGVGLAGPSVNGDTFETFKVAICFGFGTELLVQFDGSTRAFLWHDFSEPIFVYWSGSFSRSPIGLSLKVDTGWSAIRSWPLLKISSGSSGSFDSVLVWFATATVPPAFDPFCDDANLRVLRSHVSENCFSTCSGALDLADPFACRTGGSSVLSASN